MVNCGKGEAANTPAQCAGNFFFHGTGLPTVMRKNQPLVPRSNFGGKACARTAPWFRSQTLLVLGQGGGGLSTFVVHVSTKKKSSSWDIVAVNASRKKNIRHVHFLRQMHVQKIVCRVIFFCGGSKYVVYCILCVVCCVLCVVVLVVYYEV